TARACCRRWSGYWRASKSSQRDRVALLRDRRNAVLPLPADVVFHHVDRARLELEAEDGASIRKRAEAHPARAVERDAGDDLEMRRIAMPADWRPRRVFGDEPVHEIRSRPLEPCGNARAHLDQERRKFDARKVGLLIGFRIEIVALAETYDASPRRVLAKARLAKRKFRDMREQRVFLLAR